MSSKYNKASPQVREMLNLIKEEFHPHLQQAMVAVDFIDSKPFIKNRINLGRISKFNTASKLWLPDNQKYDFRSTLCADVWFGLLDEQQRKALLDLHLCCCKVEYEPVTAIVNGKKQVSKDEYGRVEYTNKVKTDDEGRPVWRLLKFDTAVIAENIKRFGIWYDDFLELKHAVESCCENEGSDNVK